MNINGTWYNELGSYMTIQVIDKNITGNYYTKVGDATGIYELVGQIDIDQDNSTAIGWVVLWNNQYGSSDSVTSWSGQIHTLNGTESIVTTSLLTTETESDDDWHSTLIGKDTFTRIEPTKEQVDKMRNKGVNYSFPHKQLNLQKE
jgi:hypothetical protein